jgi:quercetin dioxygenase-like cupin family protein
MSETLPISSPSSPISDDDPARRLAVRSEWDNLPHLGVVGDTYTILLSGDETAGRFCLIDMYVPPGAGPPLHRHDFEEIFVVLEGEVETTFRGQKRVVSADEAIHIPANSPHQFRNSSPNAVRMLCICSPAELEQFFKNPGTPFATRTMPPPKLTDDEQGAFIKKAMELGPKYRTELLNEAT